MNLHVFNDPHGFILSRTYLRFKENGKLQNTVFVNLNDRTIYKTNGVIYLKKNLRVYKKFIGRIVDADQVFFYPFDEVAAWFLFKLQKKFPLINASWIFWSYEFYQRPGNYPNLLLAYSRAYENGSKKFPATLIQKIKQQVKKLFFIPVYNKAIMEAGYKKITDFYSFLPADFKNVSENGGMGHLRYHPISFLTIEEITKGVKKTPFRPKIIIGHAAAPTANHAEIIKALAEKKIGLDILIPLEYGDKVYGESIKQLAKVSLTGTVETLEIRMELNEYNSKLSQAGFAVYNFLTQEALGNILFLAWNGTKIFLNEESSVYRQFNEWGLKIYSVNKDLNKESFFSFLSPQDAENNRKILEVLFNENEVTQYWRHIMT
jgi:dTDP-N-acetylfucosamine:lipid II N-acetylfucosaminyltransferase